MEYKRTFTEEEKQILLHDLVDIEQWVNAAIIGKIENCKKRAAIELRTVLKKEGATMLPAHDADAAKQLFVRADYKNRVAREAEEEAKRKPK